MDKINKLEFIKQVIDLLRNKVDEKKLRLLLKDYSVFFNEHLKNGKTEEEIINILGLPENFVNKLDLSNFENIGDENYNIFNEFIKYDNFKENNSKNDSLEDNNFKDNNLEDNNFENSSLNNNNFNNNSSINALENKNTTSITPVKFLLGILLLVFFIPVILCGFISGVVCIILSILCSVLLSIISEFLNFFSIIFILLTGLCILMFGIGTICLNILLIINYVKYFFLINGTIPNKINNLEDK